MKMKLLCKVTLLLLSLTAIPAIASGPISVDQLIKDSSKLDGKDVVVVGKVKDYLEKTSKKGNKYVIFKIVGVKETANVYLRDRLAKPVKDGDKVEVTGVYRHEKKVTTFTVKNEIDASKKEGKPYGVKAAK